MIYAVAVSVRGFLKRLCARDAGAAARVRKRRLRRRIGGRGNGCRLSACRRQVGDPLGRRCRCSAGENSQTYYNCPWRMPHVSAPIIQGEFTHAVSRAQLCLRATDRPRACRIGARLADARPIGKTLGSNPISSLSVPHHRNTGAGSAHQLESVGQRGSHSAVRPGCRHKRWSVAR